MQIHTSSGISLASTIDYRVFQWLKASVTLSYSTDNSYRDTYHGEESYYAAVLRMTGEYDSKLPYGGELKKDDTRKIAYMLDFNKFLDREQKHQIIASLGGEISSTKYTGLAQTHRCYLPERGRIFNAVDVSKYPQYGEWLATDREALGVLKEDLRQFLIAMPIDTLLT